MKEKIKKIENGIIVMLLGFLVDGVYVGLCYVKKDLGVIVSDVLVNCVVVYMFNVF